MSLITEEYRRLNAEKHITGPGYGTYGGRHASTVDVMCKAHGFRTVLDYGCGKGMLNTELPADRAYEVREYDPAIPGKDAAPQPADLVVCTDVLEHIEPDCLEEVMDHLQSLALRGALLIIHTQPAWKTLPDGRNTHLIVKPAHWWLAKVHARWEIDKFLGNKIHVSCMAVPR